jgi:hypothetical protein
MAVNEIATQNVRSVPKTGAARPLEPPLLKAATAAVSVLPTSHVVDESEKCRHIRDTARGEVVDFRGSGE